MKKYIGTTIRKNVNDPTAGDTPAVGVNVTIKNYPSNSAATVYSDDGATVATQPLVTDAAGKFEFYAADGRYNIEYDFNGDVTGDTDVSIFDDIEKASLSDAQTATNDEKYMTPSKVKSYVDQFGMGTNVPATVVDFNTLGKSASGFYRDIGGALNSPFGIAQATIINTKRDQTSPGVDELDGSQLVIGKASSGATVVAFRFDYDKIASTVPFFKLYGSHNLVNSQNLSGGTVASNSAVAGGSLSPVQDGTWRNVSGNDILTNGYGLFERV